MSEKQMKVLGWVATFMSVMMYVSYFPQIMNNLCRSKGNFIQPLVAAINCSLWVLLWSFQKGKRYSTCSCQCTGYRFWSSNGYYGIDLKRRLISVFFSYI